MSDISKDHIPEQDILKEMAGPLLYWYEKNARDLPWRRDPTPYHVWVSEIMLQQTRVEAVKPYYLRFIMELPTVKDLAFCPEDRLMKLWEGLGYYSRVRNMKKAAQILWKETEGNLPDSYEALCALPGIGSYTAGAVASIALGLPYPAVDGNVLRVMSRIFADTSDVSEQKVKKAWEKRLKEGMPQDQPGKFNQALMELGATVCLPNGEPMCSGCPLSLCCRAFQTGRQKEFPVKKAAKKRRTENRTVFLIRRGNAFGMRKRPEGELLAGLYEFPSEPGHLTETEACEKLRSYGFFPLSIERLPAARHVFSHVEWEMTGYLADIGFPVSDKEDTPEAAEGEIKFALLSQIKREFSVPSAYSAYMKYAAEKTYI